MHGISAWNSKLLIQNYTTVIDLLINKTMSINISINFGALSDKDNSHVTSE